VTTDFTFGGLKITNNAEVEDTSGHVIPSLYAACQFSAASTIATMPAAPASCPAPSSAASPEAASRRGRDHIQRVERFAIGAGREPTYKANFHLELTV
jgi:hypothetical protein